MDQRSRKLVASIIDHHPMISASLATFGHSSKFTVERGSARGFAVAMDPFHHVSDVQQWPVITSSLRSLNRPLTAWSTVELEFPVFSVFSVC